MVVSTKEEVVSTKVKKILLKRRAKKDLTKGQDKGVSTKMRAHWTLLQTEVEGDSIRIVEG